jgi:hypothetical protein
MEEFLFMPIPKIRRHHKPGSCEEKQHAKCCFPGRTPIGLKKHAPLNLSYTLILYSGKVNEKKIIKEITNNAMRQTHGKSECRCCPEAVF